MEQYTCQTRVLFDDQGSSGCFYLLPVKTISGAKRDSCPKGGGIYKEMLISP